MLISPLTEELWGKAAPFVPVYTAIPFDRSRPPDTIALLRALMKSPLASDGKVFFLQRSSMRDGKLCPVESLLSFAPFETLTYAGGRATIENSFGVRHDHKNPFVLLAERLAKYKLPDGIKVESFFGGALGYFSYDAARFIEPVLVKGAGNLKTASESKSTCDAEFMFFKKRVAVDYVNSRILFATGILPKYGDAFELPRALKAAEAELVQIKELFEGSQADANGIARVEGAQCDSTREAQCDSTREIAMSEMNSMLGKEAYLSGVRKIKQHILDGDIFQAVLAEQLSVPFKKNALDLFATLLKINPSPYEFYFSAGKERIILGSSPEMLLKIDGKQLETHPIAGTRPTSPNASEESRLEAELLASEKEKAEHLMLVDLARNDIGRVSEPGSVTVDEFMTLKKFGSVMHLTSVVRGILKAGVGAIEALASCFPAGTLSGAPKVRAMQILSEYEPEARGFYGGAMVSASLNGDLDSCIAIRSVRIENERATVQAGAGIVADSDPESEYAEVTHKTKMLRRALAMIGAGP